MDDIYIDDFENFIWFTSTVELREDITSSVVNLLLVYWSDVIKN